jgi:hypothetical protein
LNWAVSSGGTNGKHRTGRSSRPGDCEGSARDRPARNGLCPGGVAPRRSGGRRALADVLPFRNYTGTVVIPRAVLRAAYCASAQENATATPQLSSGARSSLSPAPSDPSPADGAPGLLCRVELRLSP